MEDEEYLKEVVDTVVHRIRLMEQNKKTPYSEKMSILSRITGILGGYE